MASFQRLTTEHGLAVFVRPTIQFKTTTVQMFIDRPFADDYSLFALLPHVLKRGNAAYPDSLALERRFDQLYGATFDVTTHRLAERHVVELQLELADQSLLTDSEQLFSAALDTLAGIVIRPLIQDGAFNRDYLEQEKEAQIRAIESVYNDKAEYAHQRCLQEMFAGDPFSRLAIGEVEQVAAITAVDLWQLYQSVLQQANFQLFISGNVQPEQVVELCARAFDRPLGTNRQAAEPSRLPTVRPTREVQEEQPVAQGKLVLAYRTGIGRHDALFLPLLVYNGLFGGYGHSKLFQNVRERASLAYDCSSDLIATKGVVLVEAGISSADLDAARAIIDQQLAAMCRREWSDEEWDKTLLALQNGLRGLADRPTRLALTHFDRLVNGQDTSEEELIAGIQQVTHEQVLTVARQLQLDTAYFLRGTTEDEENSQCN